MSVTAKELAKEARLYRESGHCSHSAKLLAVAKTAYPTDDCLKEEQLKLDAAVNPSYPRCRWALSWLVDRLGLPLFFVLMAVVASLLGPILFVPSW